MFKIIILITLIAKVNSAINEEVLDRFNQWIKKYKIIITDYSLPTILNNWIINDNYINEINNKDLPYKLGHNEYSGFSKTNFEEIKGYSHMFNINKKLSSGLRGSLDYVDGTNIINYDKFIDWREKKVVNNIKNQGECAASWAFSAIASLESAYAIKHNKLMTLSEQYLIDCDNILKGGYNLGCNGGSVKNTFKWLKKEKCPLVFDEEYNKDNAYIGRHSLRSRREVCYHSCNSINNTTNASIDKYVIIQSADEEAMLSAIYKQPVSVSIDASTRDFYFYSSGTFTASCGVNLDHSVNLIGYGTNKNGDYYILRNSWGTSWGENGYMYLPRGDYNNGDGQCGVLLEGVYPIFN